MIPQYFAYLILPIFIYSIWDYIHLILADKVSPKIISWGLWSIANIIAFTVAMTKNSMFMDVFSPFVAGVGCGCVAIFGLTRNNKSLEISKLDWLCIFFALFGILLSLVTSDPLWALIFAMISDFAAGIPTIINCFKNPEKEGLVAFSLALLSKIIGILAVKQYGLFTTTFQIQGIILNFIIIFPLIIYGIFKFKFFKTDNLGS